MERKAYSLSSFTRCIARWVLVQTNSFSRRHLWNVGERDPRKTILEGISIIISGAALVQRPHPVDGIQSRLHPGFFGGIIFKTVTATTTATRTGATHHWDLPLPDPLRHYIGRRQLPIDARFDQLVLNNQPCICINDIVGNEINLERQTGLQ
jgi:hypothetical protein